MTTATPLIDLFESACLMNRTGFIFPDGTLAPVKFGSEMHDALSDVRARVSRVSKYTPNPPIMRSAL